MTHPNYGPATFLVQCSSGRSEIIAVTGVLTLMQMSVLLVLFYLVLLWYEQNVDFQFMNDISVIFRMYLFCTEKAPLSLLWTRCL